MANLVKSIVDIINANIDEFKQIAVVGAELVQDIAGIIIKASTKIQKEVEDFFTVLCNELKALPIYQFVKQKYQEISDYKISDGLIRALADIVQSFKQVLPTRELQDLVTALFDYIVKHAKKEKVCLIFSDLIGFFVRNFIRSFLLSILRLTTFRKSSNCTVTSFKRSSPLLNFSSHNPLQVTSSSFSRHMCQWTSTVSQNCLEFQH